MSKDEKIVNLGFMGFPMYGVSNKGKVYSKKRNGSKKVFCYKELKLRLSSGTNNYYNCTIRNEKVIKVMYVHRLVAMAFLGIPKDKKAQVNHKDGVKLNNNLDNLEWSNASLNIKHANEMLLCARGSQKTGSKLKERQIPEIRKMMEEGIGPTAIAKKFGVHRRVIYDIKTGRSWSHVR